MIRNYYNKFSYLNLLVLPVFWPNVCGSSLELSLPETLKENGHHEIVFDASVLSNVTTVC